MLRKILITLAVIVVLLGVGGLGFIWQAGAWNILFPSNQHDTTAPVIGDISSPGVLIFTKTNSFRHKEGIEAGLVAMERIATQQGFGVYATENGAVFNAADLQRFGVVVFLHATGDMLSEDQEMAFQDWLQKGGGWLGVHAAGDGSHAGWQWYIDHLIGASFTAHIMGPQFQTATVVTENVNHRINLDMAAQWEAEEEWYSWDASPRESGFNIIATIDENSYSPVQDMMGTQTDLRMGDHPIAWTNQVGDGRTFYTALGHAAAAFENPQFLRQLENALVWLSSEG